MIYYKELSDKVIGSAIEVHKELGNGFLEKVYENALMIEFNLNGNSVKNQYQIPVLYKGKVVGEYFADILVEDKIILELKVAKSIEPIHEAQLIHYLKATGIKVGYILNFGYPHKLQFKRIVV
ncbi:GxxExxY protein [bacterium]|nr:GxxExxY protein [bacterium]MBU1873231.1 GxxExxY protein [bacterium]